MDPQSSPLLTDLYQLNMLQAYIDHGQVDTAVFEMFMRKLPERRGFLVAAGLEQALDYLERLRFAEDELDWLARSGRFNRRFLDYLADFRFTGDVHAMPEGTVFFADEPILRITAPLPQAQLVETRIINLLHFQSLIAAKAARMVLAAPDKLLIEAPTESKGGCTSCSQCPFMKLNTLEKVVNKLVGRIRKREREETGKDLEPELAQGDERERPFTPAPPPLTAHLARRFRSF